MSSIPPEVFESLKTFHDHFGQVEDVLENHFAVDFERHLQRAPLDQARIDLMSMYTANSLFWMYLCTLGQRPSQNENIQKELSRIQDYMGRLKEIEDKEKRPKLVQRAAKNFVRNALWEPKKNEQQQEDEPSSSHLAHVTKVGLPVNVQSQASQIVSHQNKNGVRKKKKKGKKRPSNVPVQHQGSLKSGDLVMDESPTPNTEGLESKGEVVFYGHKIKRKRK